MYDYIGIRLLKDIYLFVYIFISPLCIRSMYEGGLNAEVTIYDLTFAGAEIIRQVHIKIFVESIKYINMYIEYFI